MRNGSVYNRNLQAWRAYNASRIERARQINPDHARLAFDVIPYLLHTNHPELPGYLPEANEACGVQVFFPQESKINALRRSFPSFDFQMADARNANVSRLNIESILIMGSIGTIAQTKNSDYDYWIVVDENKMTPVNAAILQKKLTSLERWVDEQKMEVHFFLTDITKCKTNDFGATDKESSGSSQASLLKEEFYRTAILVAGKDPLWWVLPPALDDEEYEKHTQKMLEEGYLDFTDVVDMGNARHIPMGELFGALLWQFNKAMTSPHKSALKMALMESYIMAGQKAELLCDTLKRAIHEHPEYSGDADPYLLMFDYIRRFYVRSKKSVTAISSLEKCFFLKCMESPITPAANIDQLAYKEKTIWICLNRWKWDSGTLADMNNFKNWDFRKSAAMANTLHGIMLEIYKNITNRVTADSSVKNFITDFDLTVLGRKLFTLYSKKPGKIEYLKRARDEAVGLSEISFTAMVKPDKKQIWAVYRDNITSSVAKGHNIEYFLLNRGSDPVEMMMWLAQNRVYAKNSFLYFIPGQSPVSLMDLQQLMEKIYSFFPAVSFYALDKNDLVKRDEVRKIFVIVNFLEYRWKKEMETLHILYSTSWGEHFLRIMPAKQGFESVFELLEQSSGVIGIHDQSRFEVFIPSGDNQIQLRKQAMAMLALRYNPQKRKTLLLNP